MIFSFLLIIKLGDGMFEQLKQDIPDLILREVEVDQQTICIAFVESLCSSENINDFILRFLPKINPRDFIPSLLNCIPTCNVQVLNKKDNLCFYLFSGYVLISKKSSSKILAAELKSNLDRGISEPTTESSIQGAKDSFTENYLKNTGLIRKRLKTDTLALEELYVGERSKTKIGIFYLRDVIDEGLLEKVKIQLQKINIDGILDSGMLASLMEPNSKTTFPTIQLTERPDTVCASILNGKLAIIVDMTPYVLIIPSFFQDYFQASEDYYLKSSNSTLTRILRFIAGFITLTLPAFYIAITTYNQELLPTGFLLNLASQREGVPFPAVFEIIIMIFTFEILKESDIRLPSKISSAVSTVGGLVLGTAAVSAGIVSPIMVIIVALTAICSLVFSSIEMTNALRIWRILFVVFAALFGMVGILCSLLILIINLSNIEVFGKPYLLPFAPIFPEGLKDSIFKSSIEKLNKRPSYLTTKDVGKGGLK